MVVSIVVLDFACGSSGCVLWLCVVVVVVCLRLCVCGCVFVVVCLWLCVCDCGCGCVLWLRSGREHWAWMVVVVVRQGTLGVDGRGCCLLYTSPSPRDA